jgi:hypothetical protein
MWPQFKKTKDGATNSVFLLSFLFTPTQENTQTKRATKQTQNGAKLGDPLQLIKSQNTAPMRGNFKPKIYKEKRPRNPKRQPDKNKSTHNHNNGGGVFLFSC